MWHLALSLLILLTTAGVASAQRLLEVPIGGAKPVSLGGLTGRVKVADPAVASVERFGNDVMVFGRKLGETNLLLSSDQGGESWTIKVHLPVKAIQAEVERAFKNEVVSVRAMGGTIILNGTVSSVPKVQQVEGLVIGYLQSPNLAQMGVVPNVLNLLEVRTRQQVQLEVKFAEVDRKSMREIGVSFAGAGSASKNRITAGAATNDGLFNYGDDSTNQLGQPFGDQTNTFNQHGPTLASPRLRVLGSRSSFGTFFLGVNGDNFPFAAALNMLNQESLSRTLAEPILVAMSGQQATFLAGGEIPFEVTTGLGQSTVQFKPYGVELNFSPTVLEDDTIQLQTTVALSAPDNAQQINNNIGFKRRSTATTVRMRDGQSFAISGMLTDEMANVVREVPGLASLPVLGILFKSKAFERQETELIVVVTARLVDPIEAGDMPPLPGEDMLSDPNDVQLFLLNVDETKDRKPRSRRIPRRPSGSVGFER